MIAKKLKKALTNHAGRAQNADIHTFHVAVLCPYTARSFCGGGAQQHTDAGNLP
jgi:hypothetical protein